MHTLAGWWKCSGETRRIEKKKKKKIQKTPTILRLRPGTTKRNLLPRKAKLGRTPLHTEPVLQLTKKNQKNTEATWDHHLHISPDTSHYMEAVFFMVMKIYGKPPVDPVEDLDMNLANWRMFMNTTLRAAVHLGKDCDTNLRFVKNWIIFGKQRDSSSWKQKSWSVVGQKPLA